MTIKEFDKITIGFVCQRFRKDAANEFVCINQEFIASDNEEFENTQSETIAKQNHITQDFNMCLISSDNILNQLTEILNSVNVGGEQSRQFSEEIQILNQLIKALNPEL